MSIRFKLSKELVDDESTAIVDTQDEVMEYIREWFRVFKPRDMMTGQNFTVEVVDMTDEEVADLPEL